MQSHQKHFIQLALEYKALQFGEFTLKSGRKSNYFFNAGAFNDGRSLSLLGQCYADTLQAAKLDCTMLFGPAYKGIPLVSSTAIALAERYQKNYPYCFNRKEPKNHGEGGLMVGAPLKGKVAIIDDVITAGTAVREAIEQIKEAGAEPSALIIALDREEPGPNGLSAILELEKEHGIAVFPIITRTLLMDCMQTC